MQALQTLASVHSVAPVCPSCGRGIPGQDINVASDIAFCRKCNLTHSLSALASGTVVDPEVDLSQPPAGSWFRRDGDGLVTGATHRSLGQALGLLFFSLFWNGIVSVFVMLAAASTLHRLGVSLPAGFPSTFARSNTLPLGMLVFLWLFLTPFIAVGILVASSFLSCLAGRTEVRLQGGQGVIFSGVGRIGIRRRFAASDVRDVGVQDRCWQDSQGRSRHAVSIVMDTTTKPLKFGSMLSEARRRFLAGVLKKELVRC